MPRKPVPVLKDKSACGACDGCAPAVTQLGVNAEGYDHVVALAGNPNTGKSTVFNRLTGLRQHTGNWPGKTVTRAEGGFELGGDRYKLVDLPGTYSLLSASVDEEVARDFILFGRPDCVITVVDATMLERNLNLVLQVLEITGKVVVCLNLMDEARRKGITIDNIVLAERLGAPVIPVTARTGRGVPELLQAVSDVVSGRIQTTPHKITGSGEFLKSVEQLAARVKTLFPGLPNSRWVAMRLLDGDLQIMDAIRNNTLGQLSEETEAQHAS